MNEPRPLRRTKRKLLVLIATGVLSIGISTTDFLPKKLVWNASNSMPVGLYYIMNRSPLRNELVIVKLPDWAQLMASQRGYLPGNVPALKRVSALAEDRVCRFDKRVFVNGTLAAWARLSDGFTLKLPVWSGCVMLDESQVFLLADHPKSFDGRYSGVTKLVDVLGVAKPVWTRSE